MFRLKYFGAAAALIVLAGCGMPLGGYGGYGGGYGGYGGNGYSGGGSPYGAAPYGASPYGAAPYGAAPYGYSGAEAYGGYPVAPPTVVNNHIPVPVPMDPNATTSTYGTYGSNEDSYAYGRRRHGRQWQNQENQTTGTTTTNTTTTNTTTAGNTETGDPLKSSWTGRGRQQAYGNQLSGRRGNQLTQQAGTLTQGTQSLNGQRAYYGARNQMGNQQTTMQQTNMRQRNAMALQQGMGGGYARTGARPAMTASRPAGNAVMRAPQAAPAARTQARGNVQRRAQ